jgi:PTH1 family peptidyl-tRNA hydrolase
MKLIVGLGNPGAKYHDTKHNVGFRAINVIADAYENSGFQDRFDGKIAKVNILNGQVLLFMPMTYMNNSGIPLSKLVNFYKIAISDIYVIYDDLDLEIGRIKVKQGGGNGGHNGLVSIDSHVGKAYNKMRIGIGRPELKDMVSHYVLSNFTNDESKQMQIILGFITKNLNILLHKEFDKFMNLYYSINKLEK